MAAVKFITPGERQLAIIRAAVAHGAHTCVPGGEQTAATKANGNGYLARDAKDSHVWYPTDKAREMLDYLAEREAKAAAALPDAPAKDMFGLVSTVERARTALDDGDVIAAKQIASGAYLDAKARAQYAASFGDAGKRVLAKARQLQGDALLIETRARMSIAAALKQARAEGKAAKQGRPKNIPDENVFTLEEAGLSAKDMHEAQRLLDAETKSPGFAERAIAARVSAGLEPSRANLRAAVGTSTATKEERGENFYETPPEAVRALLALETFSPTIWEPACGKGAISRQLEDAGYDVEMSDLVDRGAADRFGTLQGVADFLGTDRSPSGLPYACPDIVTNPPYGTVLNAFVAHALRVHRPKKMALLLNLNFLCGFDDADREFALTTCKPARVHILIRRLPMMHRDGWTGPEASSRMNTAWFVWERDEEGNYPGPSVINRVDWKEFEPVQTESEAA